MRSQTNIISLSSITFKKWTRKAYAVFNSIKQHIVIANLDFDMHNLFYKTIVWQVKAQQEQAHLLIDITETIGLHKILKQNKAEAFALLTDTRNKLNIKQSVLAQ